MRAILHQRHEAKLWEGTLAATGARSAEVSDVLGGVADIQAGAVQADQPPLPIPRPFGRARRNRLYHLLVQPAQRRFAQPTAGLRDATLARHLDRLRTPQPAQPFQQTAQNLSGAATHVERQRNGVVDHHLCRQVALALARLARLGQDLLHALGRKCPGDHAEADVVTDPDAGRETRRNASHRCRSSKPRPAEYTVTLQSERYWR